MAGFSGLARPSTRLRVDPDGEYLAGDLTLVPGVGMTFRPSELTDGFIFDAPAVDKDAPAGLFIPDLSTWPTTELYLPPGSERFLTLMEALIAGDAPAEGTDPNNCMALRAAGTLAGQQDIHLSTPDGRAYRWNSNATQQIGRQINGSDMGEATGGVATMFTPTADITVTHVGSRNYNGTYEREMFSTRSELLNHDRSEVLATSVEDWDTPIGAGEWWSHALDKSVELKQGENYWIGHRHTEPRTTIGALGYKRSTLAINHEFTGSIARVTGETTQLVLRHSSIGTGTDWQSPVDGEYLLDEGTAAHVLSLEGTAGGVVIEGGLTLSVVEFGTAPNVPTEANVRLQWSK